MKFKKIAAAAIAGSLLAAATPAANAAEFEFTKNPNFQDGTAGDSFTGSSLTDVAVVGGGVWASLKLITDNVPSLRAQVDQFAAQIGLGGSSKAVDFNLARLARENGFPQLADQIARLFPAQ